MTAKTDYIIVGQGLAGSILAHELLKRGCAVIIFDDSSHSASKVAAGLFNPVTGKRWVKTWKAEECFSRLFTFYPALQEQFNSLFYFPMRLFRPFTTQREQNEWTSKSENDLKSLFIEKVSDQPVMPASFYNPYGGVFIKDAGYVNVSLLLEKMKMKFKDEDILIQETLEEGLLKIQDDKVLYRDMEARKIIFCDGISSMKSRYFSWLPFNPVKGEILTVDLDIKLEFIISRGIFIIPETGKRCKVGATYDRDNLNTNVSQEAREYLISKLKKVIQSDVRIIDQEAEIRPATRDRRPFVGFHPDFATIGIFNGFGSKGVSLIPYLSENFTDHLLKGDNLEPGVNIVRYFN